jgi:hypothetical protein
VPPTKLADTLARVDVARSCIIERTVSRLREGAEAQALQALRKGQARAMRRIRLVVAKASRGVNAGRNSFSSCSTALDSTAVVELKEAEIVGALTARRATSNGVACMHLIQSLFLPSHRIAHISILAMASPSHLLTKSPLFSHYPALPLQHPLSLH